MIISKTQKFNLERLSNLEGIPNLTDEARSLLEQYLEIENEYRYALREMSAKLENLDEYCQSHFDHNPIHHMESRIKTPKSIIEKINRRGYDKSFSTLKKYLYDIAGIRVICNYINDIYQIINLLSQQKDLKVYLQKDYIVNPKETGYRSYHVVFSIEMYIGGECKHVPIEIQFRTIAMDMWASLEHELRYKGKSELTNKQKENLRKYSDELYQIDLNMQRIYISTMVGDDDVD